MLPGMLYRNGMLRAISPRLNRENAFSIVFVCVAYGMSALDRAMPAAERVAQDR